MPQANAAPERVWYPAMNRWSDQTGLAHLLSPRAETARPLCGARPFSLGGGFHDPADAGCQPCPACLKRAEPSG